MTIDLNTATEVLICVDPAKIDDIWMHVKHFIEAAYMNGRGDDDADITKADLDRGGSLLWVVWDGKGLLAAAATKLCTYRGRRICVITSCGGREIGKWIKFIADIEQYAKSEKCDAIRVMGRPGWKAFLKNYTEPWICLEKELG